MLFHLGEGGMRDALAAIGTLALAITWVWLFAIVTAWATRDR
jgi:hypothetical protein